MSFARRIGIGAMLAAAVPLAFALLVWRAYRTNVEVARSLAERDQQAMIATVRLERLVIDMETAVRGFSGTGDETFLDPYRAAVSEEPELVRELRSIFLSGAERSLLEGIASGIESWRASWAEGRIAFVRAHPPRATATERVLAKFPAEIDPVAGKRGTDELRRRFNLLVRLERRRIADAQETMRRTAARLTVSLWSAAGAFSAFVLLAAVLLLRSYRRRAALLFAGIDSAERGSYQAVPLAGEDEVGRFAHAFNRMAAEVERRDEQLRRSLEELEAANRELVGQRRNLASILENVGEGVVVADASGKFVLWNPAAERIVGMGPTDIPPEEWPNTYGVFFPDLDTPFPAQELPLVRALRGESCDDVELFVRNTGVPDGAFLSVGGRPLRDERGEVYGGVVVFRDVSERKRAEVALRTSHEELERRVAERTAELSEVNAFLRREIAERERVEETLRESETRFRAILDSALDAVITIDASGLIRAWNPQAEKVFGWSREEVLGKTLSATIIPPQYREAHQRGLKHFLATGEGPVLNRRIELTALHRDGREFPVELGITPVLSGKTYAFSAFIRDLTERRNLEEQLRQSQKMEAIGRLAGGIAHDFNNLLTTILGYSDLLLGGLEPGSPLRGDLEEIKKSGERAASLTRQLLAFGRKQVIEPKVLNLNAVVTDMDRMLRRLIGEDIDLATVTDPSLGRVKADPGQIEQVVMNLAVNARDAMPEAGRLTVETKNVDLDDTYAHTHLGVAPGRYVMLAVSDTGVGMDAETQSRIFEPFFTTKEKGKGTGLGLSTVYGIVKQSGGSIWVYSERGKGTTFKVYLPRVEEEASRLAPVALAGSSRGHETVLVVEDEEAVRKLARLTLERQGYTVIEARDGDEALRIASERHDVIHLLLSDGVMTGIAVRELVDGLRSLRPEMKVLLMSGYTDEVVVRHGIVDAGAAFLQKPFNPDSLARKVREILDAPV